MQYCVLALRKADYTLVTVLAVCRLVIGSVLRHKGLFRRATITAQWQKCGRTQLYENF